MKPATSSYTVTAPHTARTAPMVRLTTSPPLTHTSRHVVFCQLNGTAGGAPSPLHLYGGRRSPPVCSSRSRQQATSLMLTCAHSDDSSHSSGTVTVFAANPSSSSVQLELSSQSMIASVPAVLPRQEFVLTAPAAVGGMASRTPVLNGDAANPLVLGLDGTLPPVAGRYCSSGSGCGDGGLTLPPHSQGFFVLLEAQATAACG